MMDRAAGTDQRGWNSAPKTPPVGRPAYSSGIVGPRRRGVPETALFTGPCPRSENSTDSRERPAPLEALACPSTDSAERRVRGGYAGEIGRLVRSSRPDRPSRTTEVHRIALTAGETALFEKQVSPGQGEQGHGGVRVQNRHSAPRENDDARGGVAQGEDSGPIIPAACLHRPWRSEEPSPKSSSPLSEGRRVFGVLVFPPSAFSRLPSPSLPRALRGRPAGGVSGNNGKPKTAMTRRPPVAGAVLEGHVWAHPRPLVASTRRLWPQETALLPAIVRDGRGAASVFRATAKGGAGEGALDDTPGRAPSTGTGMAERLLDVTPSGGPETALSVLGRRRFRRPRARAERSDAFRSARDSGVAGRLPNPALRFEKARRTTGLRPDAFRAVRFGPLPAHRKAPRRRRPGIRLDLGRRR